MTNSSKQPEVLTFKRWSRKGYAIFNSLNRVVRIGVLCITYTLVNIVTTARAQEVDTVRLEPVEEEIDEVIVSAERAGAAFGEIGRVVNVITRQDIQRSSAPTIHDLINEAGGIDLRQRGQFGVQGDVSIRGGTFDQVLILLNGVNINDPQTGHHNLNLPVDLSSVKRIEILKGPAARVHGSNAFSGAINIITRDFNKNALSVQASGGQHGYYHAGANGSFSKERFSTFLSLDHRSSDGYIENTDFNTYNLFFQSAYDFKPGKILLQAGFNDKKFGAQGFYTSRFDEYEETRTKFVSLKFSGGKKLKFTPSLYYRNHHDQFVLFRSNPSFYANFHETSVFGGQFSSSMDTRFGTTTFGGDARSEHILSNSLGEALKDSIKVPWHDTAYFFMGGNRNRAGLFLEQSIDIYRFHVSGGLYFNVSDHGDVFYDVYPGVDISFSVSDKTKLFASANNSLRQPTFHELYYTSADNLGNAGLVAEENTSLEAGVKYYSSRMHHGLSFFSRKTFDMIDWVKSDTSDLTWEARNISNNMVYGVELAGKILFSGMFDFYFPVKSVGYSFISLNSSLSANEYISKYALDYLKAKATIWADISIFRGVGFTARLIYQDRAGSYIKFENGSPAGEEEYPPFFLLNTKLYYRYKGWDLYVQATNLTNTAHVDIGNVEQPGTWVIGGASLQLDFD